MIEKLLNGGLLTFVSGVLFIVLKLARVIDWDWVWVLLPFWLPVVVFLVILVIIAIFVFTIRNKFRN